MRLMIYGAIKKKSKEKIWNNSQSGVVARGATGVRAHYKVDEEIILAHRRSGYTDHEIHYGLT